ncbi:MAG: hypothetical protein V4687_00935 [Bacteroidota bacterium]
MKNNSYKDLKQLLIDEVLEESAPRKHCAKISGTPQIPYLKKRLGGRSGYRLYCLLVEFDGKLFLAEIYPKTGSKGIATIDAKEEKRLFELLKTSIVSGDTMQVKLKNDEIVFEKPEEKEGKIEKEKPEEKGSAKSSISAKKSSGKKKGKR